MSPITANCSILSRTLLASVHPVVFESQSQKPSTAVCNAVLPGTPGPTEAQAHRHPIPNFFLMNVAVLNACIPHESLSTLKTSRVNAYCTVGTTVALQVLLLFD